MAEFNQITYTSQGTEIEFMQGLASYICNLWSGSTIEDSSGNIITVADAYDDTSVKAEFYLNFGGGAKLSFIRNFVTSQAAQSFLINNRNLTFCSGNAAYDSTGTRAYNLTYLKSNSFLWLVITAYNASAITSTSATVIAITNSGSTYVCSLNGYDFTNQPFYSSSATIYAAKLLSFQSGAGKIDYISKTPFCGSNATGVKAFDCNDIYSCTTTSVSTSLALPDGRNFYAIGTNWMVEVDPTP